MVLEQAKNLFIVKNIKKSVPWQDIFTFVLPLRSDLMTQNLSKMILGQNCQPRYINVLQTVIIQKKKIKYAAKIVEIHQDKNVNLCMAVYK